MPLSLSLSCSCSPAASTSPPMKIQWTSNALVQEGRIVFIIIVMIFILFPNNYQQYVFSSLLQVVNENIFIQLYLFATVIYRKKDFQNNICGASLIPQILNTSYRNKLNIRTPTVSHTYSYTQTNSQM